MRYLGGKVLIAKQIVKYFEDNNYFNMSSYSEPFVGSNSITPLMNNFKGKKHCFDIHEDLILLHNAIKDGWNPPLFVTELEYNNLKNCSPSALRGFVGFGCSFSGKWYGGYARSGNRNYAQNARNSLLKTVPYIQDVSFECKNYKNLIFTNTLIYCDPPYERTTKYTTGDFNSTEFWDWARIQSKNNVVLVSEYQAPEDFECVLEITRSQGLKTKENPHKGIKKIEKIFRYKNCNI